MIQLINDSREKLFKKMVYMKLWRSKNLTFEVILNTYFDGRTKATKKSHTKIYNTTLQDDAEPGNHTKTEVE